ncbi:protein of unknown function DUF327 [Alkaliphilus metalliredigens QYMF]|uniref:DUF327 domain-containing protein n=1 Tax=Alkaliphilus metalliredigens (strain QYMF) TaxID=293826 RepID=A6TLE9_ALKMQ|nr:YaaR family protein [Alkaliphilus metalliredigens]ABR47017.1 protein of unknown function DUF327 [Alkaliphilus metalliredigens QYMF]
MNRIDGVNPMELLHKLEGSPRSTKAAPKQEFISKLEGIKSEQVRDHLQKLYNEITVQSDRISDKLHLSDVIQYKKLVREFMDVAVKNSHHFSKQNFLDRRGRHRVYSIVKNVDRELESITQDFLKQEVDRLSIIKRLDDIRGMLLDVFM